MVFKIKLWIRRVLWTFKDQIGFQKAYFLNICIFLKYFFLMCAALCVWLYLLRFSAENITLLFLSLSSLFGNSRFWYNNRWGLQWRVAWRVRPRDLTVVLRNCLFYSCIFYFCLNILFIYFILMLDECNIICTQIYWHEDSYWFSTILRLIS